LSSGGRLLARIFLLRSPVVNTIIADSLDYMAEKIRKAQSGGKDFNAAGPERGSEVVKDTKERSALKANNYSEEWLKEAKKRGLANIASTIEARKH